LWGPFIDSVAAASRWFINAGQIRLPKNAGQYRLSSSNSHLQSFL